MPRDLTVTIPPEARMTRKRILELLGETPATAFKDAVLKTHRRQLPKRATSWRTLLTSSGSLHGTRMPTDASLNSSCNSPPRGW